MPDRHEEWARRPIPPYATRATTLDECPVCGGPVQDPDERHGCCSAECEADELAGRLARAEGHGREMGKRLRSLLERVKALANSRDERLDMRYELADLSGRLDWIIWKFERLMREVRLP
ncbi:MAG: hypothetical protein QJR03_15100 [Sphaerobacter sp.]|nr:hypothetical protein [Sphaerobacter sp.]